MSALWHDLHQALPDQHSNEILYADDTLLYSRSAEKLDTTLKQVETESHRYGLALNYAKCEFIGINYTGLPIPRFTNKTKVKQVKQARYLGVLLTEKAQPQLELQDRIKQATITWKRLNILWKIGKCSTKTKLLYWNAVIKTKLTYALETMHLTKTQLQKLDTFQLKGLRQILKMHTTFIERDNTNKQVRKRAAFFLYPKENGKGTGKGTGKGKGKRKPPRKLTKVSKEVKRAQMKLFTHLLREPADEPTRQATFQNTEARPNIGHKKRVGRPRQNWTIKLMKKTWHNLRKEIPEHRRKKFRKRSKTIQHWLHDAANLRLI